MCFFFNDTAPTEIYTLSLHDALPISNAQSPFFNDMFVVLGTGTHDMCWDANEKMAAILRNKGIRSEEHTSELQSLTNLVCRLLLEKKKKYNKKNNTITYKYNEINIY